MDAKAAAAIVEPSDPDRRPLTAAALRHRTYLTASTGDAVPRHVVAGLPHALPPIALRLRDGDTLPLWIGSVQKQIAGRPVRMPAYNGSIPGPLLRVAQGSEITVDLTNNAGFEQTVHWHGLHVENRDDGVPYQIQQPIPVLGVFSYHLRFPDPGLYWYHSYAGEDDGRQMGLYGEIIVDPAGPGYWPQVNREIPLILDDVLITEDGHRRVGGDSGRYEREDSADTVMLAPSEIAIVDVLFDTSGDAVLEHRTLT